MSATEVDMTWNEWPEAELEGEDALLPEGRHTVVVTAVTRPKKDEEALRIHYRVVESQWPSAIGLTCSERLSLARTEGARKRLHVLAKRLGWAERGGPLPARIDWARLVGERLIVQTTIHEYEKRDGSKAQTTQWTYAGVWPASAGPDSGRQLTPAPGARNGQPSLPGIGASATEEGF